MSGIKRKNGNENSDKKKIKTDVIILDDEEGNSSSKGNLIRTIDYKIND